MADQLAEPPAEYLAALDSILEKDTSVPILSSADGAGTMTAEEIKAKAEDQQQKPPEQKAPEPKIEKKPESKVEDNDDDLPEVLPNEGRSEKWKQFRGEYKQKKQALKERETEITTLKAEISGFEGTKKERDELKSRLEELQKQNEELSKIDSVAKLERLPDFRRKYDEPHKDSVEKLRNLSGIADINADELVATLDKSPKERYRELDSILSGAPESLKGKIISEIARVEELREGRAKELEDASTNLRRFEEQRARQMSEESKLEEQTRNAIFERVLQKVGKDTGLDEAAAADARKIFLTNDNLELAAELVIKAKAHDLTAKERQTFTSRIAELEQQVKDYQSASPSIDAGRSKTSTDEQRPDEDYVAFMKRKMREATGG